MERDGGAILRMFSDRLTAEVKMPRMGLPKISYLLSTKIPVSSKIILLQFSSNLCCRERAWSENTGCWDSVCDARPHPGGLTLYLLIKEFIGKEISFSNVAKIKKKKRGRVVQCSNLKGKDIGS